MSTTDLGITADFPLLSAKPGLVFLDNAATTHKPGVVIDAEADVYRTAYANIHRAIYDLAQTATQAFEGARERAAAFIQAASSREIIFTNNASAALNLAAYIEGQKLQPGDEILVSVAGHHSNILPWLRLAQEKKARIRWMEITPDFRLDMASIKQAVTKRTKVVALAHVSNVLGDVAEVAAIAALAHSVGARVVVDGAQSSCRMPIDVQVLDVDYMAFSAHKMYGPTGVGWLYAREELLSPAQPLMAGGGTIKTVTREAIEWADVPWRFEAGTPDIAGVTALTSLFNYLEKIDMKKVWEHDQALTEYLLEALTTLPGINIYGPTNKANRAALFSFSYSIQGKMIHPHDVADICNTFNVAIRGGHHCAQPLMHTLGVETVNRASSGIYTTTQDIDRLIEALKNVNEVFAA